MSTPPSILIFAGSSRVNSFNRKLAKEAARLVRDAGARPTYIELQDLNIPLYNADLEARGTPRDVIRLKELMHGHAGWIIASPEYNGSYTALLKNTIDWASSPAIAGAECSALEADTWKNGTKPFTGKVVGLLSASPGGLGGLRSLDHLAPLLRNLHCWLAPQQFALGKAADAFDAQGHLKDASAEAKVKAVVNEVIFGASRLAQL
ncbi:MAG: NADPH-dependent oxidoreductase [Burkholderiales bacterium]|nr:MAG: NADPH-dependent oxidoreductase [Burkholderiales bacterium]